MSSQFQKTILWIAVFIGVSITDLVSQMTNPNVRFENIDITDGFFKEKRLMLSEISSEIEYIRLETRNDVYIKNIDDISIGSQYICIADTRTSRVFLFSKQGHFIKFLGRLGKGPGEFVGIDNISLSWDEKWCALFDGAGKKAILFSTYTDDFKEISISGEAAQVEFGPNNNLLASYTYPLSATNSDFQFSWINFGDASVRRFGKVPESIRNWGSLVIPVFGIGKEMFVDQLYNDTIYTILQDGDLRPRIYFEIRKNRLPSSSYQRPERLLESTATKAKYGKFLYTDGWLFINAQYLNKVRQLCYNRKDNSCFYLPYNSKFQDGVIENDLDGGPPVWPDVMTFSGDVANLLHPYKILEYKDQGLLNCLPPRDTKAARAFNQLVSELNDHDNPIIQIIKLKH